METMPSLDTPQVESFVLRFVSDAPMENANPSARTWRVHVVHVQTSEEKSFANIAEAIAFIARYVPVGDFSFFYGESDGQREK